MNKLLIMVFSFLVSVNTNAETVRLSEPVVKDSHSETFGKPLNTALPAVSLVSLATQPNTYLGKAVQVETLVSKVCQKKGCFFIAQENGHILRVSFRDYGFFIPTNSLGKTVILNGELVEVERSQEQAAHFNKDLKSENGELKKGAVYEIVADSINIPLS